MELVGAAAGWLLGRLRADAESGLWSVLRGLVVADPLTVALENVTENALRQAVRSSPGGADLEPGDVDHVVVVLGNVWRGVEVGGGPVGDTLLGRLAGITTDAMARCATPVEGLGDEFGLTSSLAVLERDYGLVLDPEGFALELAYRWQRGVRDAAVTNPVLAPLAGELLGEIGHELVNAAREDVLTALGGLATAEMVREGFDGVTQQLDEVLDRLSGPAAPGEAVFPQFVGVPDRNPVFVGRTGELDELGEELGGGGATVIAQVAAGLGGVGKTALATEFCHRARGRVDVVRWLAAESREALVTAYLAMGPALGLHLDGLGLDDAVARVRAWFETTARSWLLVFDNVESPHVLDGLVPGAGSGRVLVTSRYQDWSHSAVTVLRVGVLEVDDAVTLLMRLTGRTSHSGAEDLVVWLGGLALAVEQAAAFCRQTGWSFAQYQRHIEQRSRELLARNPAALRRLPGGDGPDMVVLTVWDSSLEQATSEAPGAPGVLGVLAYLGAENIPRALLAEPAASEELLRGGDVLHVDEALAALARYSLVDLHRDPDSDAILAVSVHRLLQEVTRLSHHDQADPTEACGTAIRLLQRSWPANTTDPTTWPTCRLLEPHLLAVVHHADHHGIEQQAASWLLDRYGTYLQYAGNPLAAPAYFEHAVQAQKQLGTPDDQTLVIRQANLASSYRAVGRVPEAIALEERVLADSERILGDDHPNTLTTRGNLANSYRSAGRVPEAIALEERVLADSERVLGDDHPDTLRARGNLAGSYRLAGRVPEAIALLERVLADCERVLGDDHPNTLISRGNLAHSYWSAGRVPEAITLEEHVVADSERVLGDDHPDTLTARGNLAAFYRSAGRAPEAIALLQRVLADSERVLGDDHPDTLTARGNLAAFYRSAGRAPEAIALLQRVLADSERILGDDHSDTLTTRQALDLWKTE